MSKCRQTRSNIRKNNIRKKTTIILLAISLVMVTSQNMTTYAFFKDTESVLNDLIVKMGSVSVDVTKGFDKVILKKENEINHTFKMKNTGTLKQSLTFKLVSENRDIFNYVNYSVGFAKHNNKNIKMISGNLNELLNKEIQLKYEDESPVILNKNEVINANVKITMDKNKVLPDLLDSIKENKFRIDLNVIANQSNSNNIEGKGFSFVYIQENYLKIKFKLPNNEIDIKEENEKDYSKDKIENIEQVNKEEDSSIKLEENKPSKEEEDLNNDKEDNVEVKEENLEEAKEKNNESLLNNQEVIEETNKKQDLKNN